MEWQFKMYPLSMEWSYGLYRIKEVAQPRSDRYMIFINYSNKQIYDRSSICRVSKEELKRELEYYFDKHGIEYD